MKISIIVPVYNCEDYLKRCVDSLLNQTYKNLEIILVDDGSTDNSSLICDEYSNADNRVVVFHLKNGGAAAARNYGINKSNGDYLFFVDADDFIEDDAIECLLNIGENMDIIYCDYYRYYEDESKEYIRLIPFEGLSKVHILAMPGPVCKLIKRELFNNISFLEGRRYEDMAIMPFVSASTDKVAYLKEAKYYYFQRLGSSMHQTNYNETLNDIFYAFENLMRNFNDEMKSRFKDEIEYLYIEHLLHAASLRFLPYDEGIKSLDKIVSIMKSNYPKWYKNKYFKAQNIKYKIVCMMVYMKRYKLLRKILKK